MKTFGDLQQLISKYEGKVFEVEKLNHHFHEYNILITSPATTLLIVDDKGVRLLRVNFVQNKVQIAECNDNGGEVNRHIQIWFNENDLLTRLMKIDFVRTESIDLLIQFDKLILNEKIINS